MEELLVNFYIHKSIPGKQNVSVERILNSFKLGKFRDVIDRAREYYCYGDFESYDIIKHKLIAVTLAVLLYRLEQVPC